MKILRFAAVYTALALFANTAVALDVSALEALRDGGLKKLVFTDAPEAMPAGELDTHGGGTDGFENHRGKVLLVNFWATWCAPCREEMPSLDALQGALGGDDFSVLTVATGPNSAAAIDRFFEEVGVQNLPVMLDPRQRLAREVAVLGLPATLLVDREGNVVARLLGDADWNSDSARAIISAVIDDAG